GTVFLDEIGDMPLNLQGKLLRTLQEKTFSPIGSNESVHFEARIIAATNRDLAEMVDAGTFRRDLYYRLNVVEIKMPPLSQRVEDIPLLCSFFIAINNRQQKKSIKGLSREAEAALLAHNYAGNVRELANMLEYACIFASGDWIEVSNLPTHLFETAKPEPARSFDEQLVGRSLQDLEREAIIASYHRNHGKRKAIAAELQISERSLWTKLREYGLQ
ncbi:MAG: sigma 54-interacting transcriptional regulator, partial [Oscillibacter sp.]